VSECRLIWAQVHTSEKRHIQQGVKAADQLMSLGVDEHRQLTYLAAVGEYKYAASPCFPHVLRCFSEAALL
jgi:hypothetical protein